MNTDPRNVFVYFLKNTIKIVIKNNRTIQNFIFSDSQKLYEALFSNNNDDTLEFVENLQIHIYYPFLINEISMYTL